MKEEDRKRVCQKFAFCFCKPKGFDNSARNE